jgi:peroxiredoxin
MSVSSRRRVKQMLREDIVVGGKFPDIALPDHTGTIVHLSEINRLKDPLAVIFYRGWY